MQQNQLHYVGVIPIKQTILGRGPQFNEDAGNCLQAALASVLELPLDNVPHFCGLYGDSEWYEAMNQWLDSRFGLRVVYLPASQTWKPTGFHLLSGVSPRGSQHETVGFNGEMVHDPHPVGGGVSGEMFYGIFVATDPADITRDIKVAA